MADWPGRSRLEGGGAGESSWAEPFGQLARFRCPECSPVLQKNCRNSRKTYFLFFWAATALLTHYYHITLSVVKRPF